MAGWRSTQDTINDDEIDDDAFNAVATQAILEWPERLDVSSALQRYSDGSELYTVVGLREIDEKLFLLHKDAPEALLMSQMHSCILTILHALARYVTVLYPQDT